MDRSVIRPDIAVVVLAGGQATRMGGGDKGRREIGGTSIIARVVASIGPQTERLLLSANGPPERFADLGLTVIGDAGSELRGPLAGLLSAMNWLCDHAPEVSELVSVPADCPFLPRDLVERLISARDREQSEIAMASSGGQIHPISAIWPVVLREELSKTLAGPGSRSVLNFAKGYSVAIEEFDADPIDPFFNVNTPDDLAKAESLAQL